MMVVLPVLNVLAILAFLHRLNIYQRVLLKKCISKRTQCN